MQVKEVINNLYKLRKKWLELEPNATDELLNKCPINELSRHTLHPLCVPRARYTYTIDTNVTELIRAVYKLVTAYSGISTGCYYIAAVSTDFFPTIRNDALIDISVLASLNEVSEACTELEQHYESSNITYTKNDTADNAYVYIPDNLFFTSATGNLNIHPIRIIMHRNSNRNDHINDACVVLLNRFLNYLNESAFTVHKFTTEELMVLDAIELPDLDAFYALVSNTFEAKRLALMDAAERAKLEIQKEIYEKFNDCIKDYIKPYIKEGTQKVPMHNGDLSQDYRNKINNIQQEINEYYRNISRLFLELDNANNNLKAALFGEGTSLRKQLIESLRNIYEAPNSFLKSYSLDDTQLRLYFIAPILYWEEDEIKQWVHSNFVNRKYVKLITSKRFQLWCNSYVYIDNHGISGGEYDAYGIDDIVDTNLINANTDAEEFVNDILEELSNSARIGLAASEYVGHTIRHGHVGRYSCFGNNESTIIKAFREGNYDLALNVIIHCITQINLTDAIVVEWFCNNFDHNSRGSKIPCFLDTTTNTWYTADEALAILESEGN